MRELVVFPMFLGGIGWGEILIIALVILLFVGGAKIPELMKGLGKGVRSFKEGIREGSDDQEDTGGKQDEEKKEK